MPFSAKDFLLQLVAIPSITDSPEESAPLSLIESALRSEGVSSISIYGEGTKKSIVATAGEGEPLLLFCSHMDVVPAEPHLFVPRIEDGKLFARGAADAKGSVASMFAAFLRLSKQDLPGKVFFVAVSDEENAGQYGARVVSEANIRARYGIFGEPTNLQPIIAEKGFLRLVFKSQGKAAHAAFPEEGRNAILPLMQALQETCALVAREPSHPLLGSATAVPTIIRGGEKVNVVPSYCEAQIDIRYLPHQSPETLEQQIATLAQAYGDIAVERISEGVPFSTSLDSPLVQAATQAAQQEAIGIAFGTDARFFAQDDVIVLGPGSPELSHQQEESIVLADVDRAVEIYVAIADAVCKKQAPRP